MVVRVSVRVEEYDEANERSSTSNLLDVIIYQSTPLARHNLDVPSSDRHANN